VHAAAPRTPLKGCYAEFVAADEAWVAHVPDNLPLEVAAGVPLVALTGWQARWARALCLCARPGAMRCVQGAHLQRALRAAGLRLTPPWRCIPH
jgi:NADPH:quinone reductase-like Zn-dependent oxidoreductase